MVQEALLAYNDADCAYLRRWILRWIDEYGHAIRDAEKMPEKGRCCERKEPGKWFCAKWLTGF